jgi:hypothetical protein
MGWQPTTGNLAELQGHRLGSAFQYNRDITLDLLIHG